MRTLSPITVAERLLWLRRDQETTPLHIVKLVYLCHGWMLGITGKPLVSEKVVTGQFGPVLQSLYDRYEIYGSEKIIGPDRKGAEHPELDRAQRRVIDFVHEGYKSVRGAGLSELTHAPGTPWSEISDSRGLGAVIPTALIQSHYQRLLAEVQRVAAGVS